MKKFFLLPLLLSSCVTTTDRPQPQPKAQPTKPATMKSEVIYTARNSDETPVAYVVKVTYIDGDVTPLFGGRSSCFLVNPGGGIEHLGLCPQ